MNDYFNYDFSEILDIESSIDNLVNILNSDIRSSLNKKFAFLEELELYDVGLSKYKKNVDSLIDCNNKINNILKEHESDLKDFEDSQLNIIKEGLDFSSYTSTESNYSGEVVNAETIELEKVADAKIFISTYIKEVIPSFSYDRKLALLKNILNDENGSLSLLTNSDEKDILLYKLENILNEKYDINLSKLSKEEEQQLQKEFFDSISDNDTNIFDDLSESSLLSGFSYYKQVASKNGISVSDLIFKEENNDMFLSSVREIYENNEIDVLTDIQVKGVKDYIDKLAIDNGLEVLTMLNSNEYCSLIKGGIYYDY